MSALAPPFELACDAAVALASLRLQAAVEDAEDKSTSRSVDSTARVRQLEADNFRLAYELNMLRAQARAGNRSYMIRARRLQHEKEQLVLYGRNAVVEALERASAHISSHLAGVGAVISDAGASFSSSAEPLVGCGVVAGAFGALRTHVAGTAQGLAGYFEREKQAVLEAKEI
ncbi:hypothetical protein JCM8097_007283 [Rhodosporidiobolus ruineniae]